jgi:DNA-binding transcriptional MerR regulator
MRIGELASQAGTDAQTVRYYEREGLLEAPSRTASGYRAYGTQHVERLNFIRHCRSLDMPLAEIKRLIDLSGNEKVSCEDVDQLVRSQANRAAGARGAAGDARRSMRQRAPRGRLRHSRRADPRGARRGLRLPSTLAG